MNTRQALEELTFFNSKFPREAMETAVQHKEEFTLTLLNALDYVYEQKLEIDQDFMLHQYAIYLLGQFREKKAFPKLLKLLELDYDTLDALIADTLTEDYPDVLCSTFNGDLELLKSVIENKTLNFYARDAALGAYGRLFLSGKVSRESYVSYLRESFNRKAGDELFQMAINCAVDFKLHELIPEIKQAYMNQEAFGDIYNYSEIIEGIFSEGCGIKIYIENAIDTMEAWGCFVNKERDKLRQKRVENFQKKELPASKKVGRNDPCPCGSGKKYKKCCLNSSSKTQDFFEQEALEHYPSMEIKKVEGQMAFGEYFKDEVAIEINQLIHLGKPRRFPMKIKINERDLRLRRIDYLWKAYELIKGKIEREQITTFQEYDEKHTISYFTFEWLEWLYFMIKESDLPDKEKRQLALSVFVTRYKDKQ